MLFLAAVSPSPTTREVGARNAAPPCGGGARSTHWDGGGSNGCSCPRSVALLQQPAVPPHVEERQHVVRGGRRPVLQQVGEGAQQRTCRHCCCSLLLLLVLLLLFVLQLRVLPSAAAGVVVPCPPVARFTLKAPLAPAPSRAARVWCARQTSMSAKIWWTI
jgi:hypothetical protein